MDTLDTSFLSQDTLASRIAAVENKYPSLAQENERIRDIFAKLGEQMVGVDLGAALVSTCRSDTLNCGRCRFWTRARQLGACG